MTDPEKRREEARAESTCKVPPPSDPSCQTDLPEKIRRVEDPCGNSTLPDPCKIDTSKFVAPPPATPVFEASPAAHFVRVFNAAFVATCPTGSTGATVTVSAADAALTQRVQFSVLQDLTRVQLSFLDRLSQTTLDTFATMSAEDLVEHARLTPDQAVLFRAALLAAKATADSQAEVVATSALDCLYLNDEQTATCPPDANGIAASTAPSTVNAGTVNSRASKADANAKALALAQSALACQWLNTAQTATCPAGSVTSYTVNSGEIASAVSRAEANARALELAASQLICFYTAPAIAYTCDPDEDDVPALERENENPVTVGPVTSQISQELAEAERDSIAASLLRCQWGNTEVTITCPSSPNPDDPENPVPADPEKSPRPTVTIATNQILSAISYADAMEQASLLALSVLECVYCNTAIASLCTEEEGVVGSVDARDAVPAGTYCMGSYEASQDLARSVAAVPRAIKITGESPCRFESNAVAAYCQSPQPAEDVGKYVPFFVSPAYATPVSPKSRKAAYLAAGSIVLTTPTGSKALATAQAGDLALSLLDCFFESVRVDVYCGDSIEYFEGALATALPLSQNSAGWSGPVGIKGGKLDGAYVVSDKSVGHPAKPSTVLAGTYTSSVSQAEANRFAVVAALSALDCRYASVRVEALCGDTLAQYDLDTTPAILTGTGEGKLDGVSVVHEKSTGNPCNPATVLAAAYTSQVSQEEANRFAVLDALGRLNCYYYNNNEPEASECPVAESNMILLKSGRIGVGRVRSEVSQADANDQAQILAESLVVCIAEDMVGSGGEQGSPGTQGNPGNCSSSCSAVYS